MKNSLPSLPKTLGLITSPEGETSLSVYTGELTTGCIIENVKKLKQAFPALPPGYYDVLAQRVKDTGIGDARLTDAINHVIDTCVYPTPAIANFLSYDKRIRLFTYAEMCDLVPLHGNGIWNDYKIVRKLGKTNFWASVLDIETYNIKPL